MGEGIDSYIRECNLRRCQREAGKRDGLDFAGDRGSRLGNERGEERIVIDVEREDSCRGGD